MLTIHLIICPGHTIRSFCKYFSSVLCGHNISEIDSFSISISMWQLHFSPSVHPSLILTFQPLMIIFCHTFHVGLVSEYIWIRFLVKYLKLSLIVDLYSFLWLFQIIISDFVEYGGGLMMVWGDFSGVMLVVTMVNDITSGSKGDD